MDLPDDYLLREARFPELRDLLDSYASAGWTFTDTPEEAGPALQAYARYAVNVPGLLDAVIREIDDLLRVGLFSDEISDDVDVLPRISPPAGRTVEECLAVARNHLDRVRNGGSYERADLPQTDWEWGKHFYELGQLLGGYFHQYFSQEYGSHKAALDDYLSGSSREEQTHASEEIDRLLSMVASDSELSRVTKVLGLWVYPPQGLSLRHWLTDVRATIMRHLRSGS
ncbi:contact-dependent growth inhibition system immunity protein [Streptomyces cylindrosporus]|uniref:Contact-dependent growth inhibition system immunity protein n=1 Tax=Streptomyces cylindrosporus TaxID=2927583 RepID=A0ABS9Y6E5_9ACTN|nr:contact-dependent growth inhibition system immunity protein [Streptomyces cylindrosporus]MCI3272788.1 contact-dependent growth inhibition system immunity protein [Streptomyces cylindrosporus]